MTKKFSKRSKKLLASKSLPPNYHKLPGQPFDIKESLVVKWLIRQPDLLNFLWDHVRQSEYIRYNPNTGKWQGVDYDDN